MYKFDILHRLEKQSPTVILCMGIVLQATITTADLATSALFSLSPLYVSPIAFVGWFGSRFGAYALAIFAGLARVYVLLTPYSGHTPLSAIIFSSFTETFLFLAFACVTICLRHYVCSLALESRTDALTGMPNRRHFFEICDIEITRAQRYKTPLT